MFCGEEGREEGGRICREPVIECGCSDSSSLEVIEDLAIAFLVVVFAVILAAILLAITARRYYRRLAGTGRRFSQTLSLSELEFDRSLHCRGGSLPPPYTPECTHHKSLPRDTESPPEYLAIEDTQSFVVFISNIQKMLSLGTQGGDQFIKLLE